MSTVVSFRFLHVITNVVTNDHITVGVLQWDGKILRFASDYRKVAVNRGRTNIKLIVEAIKSQIKNHIPNGIDVREAFPVPEGDGSMLRWGIVHHGLASDPERQFRDLVRLAEINI